jgi:hypothetical protein
MYKRIEVKKIPEINEWLFPKVTVILISGKAGVGKTTAAFFIRDYLMKNVTEYCYLSHFAKGVKDVALAMGWDEKKDDRGRKLLQDVGNFGREYNKDAWVNYLIDHVDSIIPEGLLDVLIVDDWRFPNEAAYFKDKPERYKIFTINIQSPKREILRGTRAWKDISETSLDGYKYFDYVIKNLDTLEVFEKQTVDVLLDIIEESKKGGKS